MQYYLDSCLLSDRAVFPAQADAVRMWRCLFRPGLTFGLYLSRLIKAAILLRRPTDWMGPEIRSTARGLVNAHDLPFLFQNYLSASDLARLIRRAKFPDPMGIASFPDALFLLRVPSDAISTRRATESDLLTDFGPPPSAQVCGRGPDDFRIRASGEIPSAQENQTRFYTSPPLFVLSTSDLARLLIPAHIIWHMAILGVGAQEAAHPRRTGRIPIAP